MVPLKKLILAVTCTAAICMVLLLSPQILPLSYTPVEAFRAVSTTTVSTVSASGTLRAASKEDICFGCPVKIAKYDVAVGKKVRAGDRLFEVDQAVTLQALQNRDESLANGSSSGAAVSSSADAASSELNGAQEKLQQALSAGIIGKNTYDQFLQKIQSASGATAEQAASSAAADAQQTIAQETMAYIGSHLTAPCSGTVTSVNDTGSMIAAGDTLVEISDLNAIEMDAQVPESQIKNIAIGQAALVTGDGFSGSYAGEVTAIAPTTTTDSGSQNTVLVTIQLDHGNSALKPGMNVNALIRTSSNHAAILVPYESVLQDSAGSEYVFVFQNGKALRRTIAVGDETDDGVQVRSGVRQGDVVLENPPASLTNGSSVRIKR